MRFHFLEFYKNGIIYYVLFFLLGLGISLIVILRFVHINYYSSFSCNILYSFHFYTSVGLDGLSGRMTVVAVPLSNHDN